MFFKLTTWVTIPDCFLCKSKATHQKLWRFFDEHLHKMVSRCRYYCEDCKLKEENETAKETKQLTENQLWGN